MRRFLLLAVIILATTAAGCERASREPSDVVRTDSAGVRIVASGAVDRELPWQFEEIDRFRDTLGEPWIFEGLGVRRVVTDRAGRTYVLTGDPAVVRFGRDGRFERSVGRRGGGPGEMEFPRELIIQGDSLAVLDPVRGALVRFGPDLSPIADFPLRDGLASVEAIAFRSGGLWVLRREFESGSVRAALHADTLGGTPLLAAPVVATQPVTACNGRVHLSLPPFFSPVITWASERGRLLANVGPSYELWLYDGPRVIASVRRNVEQRAPVADDIARLNPDGFRIRVMGGGPGAECKIDFDDLVRSPGVAELFPHVHGLTLLSDGTIWVQRSVRDEQPAVVDVFTSDGAYAGTVRGMRLPLALLPNGELLVPRDDEDSGGEHIVRYRVTR